jgi:Cu(I)/Ag(I) efflux system protein CusF
VDLPVTSKVDLSGVKAGDKVSFKLKLGRDKT